MILFVAGLGEGQPRDQEIPTAHFHFWYWKLAVGKPVSRHVVGRFFGVQKPLRPDFNYTTAIFHVLVWYNRDFPIICRYI
jgi:hypothetical protein